MATKTNSKSTVMIQKWKHIHFVGKVVLEWPRPKGYRFMPYSRVMQMFKENMIAFVSPEKWDDPYEKKYLNIKVNGRDNLPNIACLCFKTSLNDNSAAFWNSIRKDGEPVVRLTIDLPSLWNVLDDFAEENKAEIYVSSVEYVHPKTINEAYKNPAIVKSKLVDSYIRLMSLKRNAYKYEDELRIFIAWEKDNVNKVYGDFEKNHVLKIGLKDCVIVKKILLDQNLSKIETAIQFKLLDKQEKKAYRELEDFLLRNKLTKKIEISKSSFEKYKTRPHDIRFPLYPKDKRDDKVVVAVINWDMTDEMNSDNVAEYVAEAFREYENNPVTWNHYPKYIHGDERVKQRHLKSRISRRTHIWIVDYNSEASLPLDGLITDYYRIKKDKTGNVRLTKSKANAPCLIECLDSAKLPCSVDDDPITFMLLEDLIWD